MRAEGSDREADVLVYLTDVEGRWDKLVDFAHENPAISLTADHRLHLADNAAFVFGGDAIDRGPLARRFVRALIDLKRRCPERVILLAGNRDINKLRLSRELRGHAPQRAPEPLRTRGGPELLRWIFRHTMGAGEAFAHRQEELRADGSDASDDAVVQSFLHDLDPGGDMREYLTLCQLAWRWRETLFLHGGITADNHGLVPLRDLRSADADAWVRDLNDFYRQQMQAFLAGDMTDASTPGWSTLVEYQAPVRGTRLNQRSVVYARPSSDNQPRLPPRAVIDWLAARGIERVVLGHTPSGDFPAVLRGARMEFVLADNSYAKVERGSRVTLRDRTLTVEGWTHVSDDHVEPVRFETSLDRHDDAIGRFDPVSGHLVKGRLARGEFVLFAFRTGFVVDQILEDVEGLARRTLVEPPEDLDVQPPPTPVGDTAVTETTAPPPDGHVFLLCARPDALSLDATCDLRDLPAALAFHRAQKPTGRLTLAIDASAAHDPDAAMAEAYTAIDRDGCADVVILASTEVSLTPWRLARRRSVLAHGHRKAWASLDPDAVTSLREGRSALVAGFGLALCAGLPAWDAIGQEVARALGVQLSTAQNDPENVLDLCAWYRHAMRRPGASLRILREVVRGLYGSTQTARLRPSLAHHLLASLAPETVYTVCFDDLLERALSLRGATVRTSDELLADAPTAVTVVKLFGDAEHGRHLVLSRDDYATPFASRHALDQRLVALAERGRPALVGYGRRDVPMMRLERRLRDANAALRPIVASYEDGAADEPARGLARWLDALTDAIRGA